MNFSDKLTYSDEQILKEREYHKYIHEHILNVSRAYNKYADILCKKLNISKYSLGIMIYNHDRSKYSEEEFSGYRQWFFPCSDETKNKEWFDQAWEHHYKNNSHHPEYWINSFGEIENMPPINIAEMLLDWEAMSMKFGGTTYEYYMKERDNKPFSEFTKKTIDSVIDIFK